MVEGLKFHFLRWWRRNNPDYDPPSLGPEVPHRFDRDANLNCCHHCGGGRLHTIHKEPWNPRRMAEIETMSIADPTERGRKFYELTTGRKV